MKDTGTPLVRCAWCGESPLYQAYHDSASGLPPLPDLAELWQQMTPDDPDARAELLLALREAETRLSDYRRELHERIDHETGELIARYRENPALALTALHERLSGA